MASTQRSEPQPLANFGGRPSALKPEHIAALHAIVAEHAQASLEEIADELDRRCGLRVCTATIRRTLRAQGIVRLKATRRLSPTADKGPKRKRVPRRGTATLYTDGAYAGACARDIEQRTISSRPKTGYFGRLGLAGRGPNATQPIEFSELIRPHPVRAASKS
jgi:hypothetical protein